MPVRSAFLQTAFIVNDLDAAMQRWLDTARIGPFFTIRHAGISDLRYRGAPATLDVSFGIVQAGAVQIELIQQHCQSPSAYRDTFPAGSEGVHHLCTVTDDYDAEIARYAERGCVPATEGRFGEMRFAYVDTRAEIGLMTEVIEDWQPVQDIHRLIADASVGWDGRDPIRNL